MSDVLSRLTALLGLPGPVVVAGLVITGLLAAGSLVRFVALRGLPRELQRQKLGSLSVWWVMLAAVVTTVVVGKVGGAITFGMVSGLALREYFRMLDREQPPVVGRWLVYLTIPVTYAAVIICEGDGWLAIAPVVVVVSITIRLVLAGVTDGYVAAASRLTWGYLVLVYFLAHAAMLLAKSSASNPIGGGAGWLIYLIMFTEADDIFQALWGRRVGRHKITPVVSPGKTWEGFLLGGITAVGLGMLFAPWLTPLANPAPLTIPGWLTASSSVMRVPLVGVVTSGLLLCIAGFFGDLNMSAVKRNVQVKDSGDWLPGQGGILDRIDSLTFTAPVFYYFVRTVYG